MANSWKTLFDGEVTTDETYNYDGRYNGYLLWLWDNQLTSGENSLAVGDTVRVTINGVANTYIVQADGSDAVQGGNVWLSKAKTSTAYTDDGTDFCFREWRGGLRSYVRNEGTYQVKFEIAVPVSQLNHAALMQGFSTMLSPRRNRT